MTSNFLAKGTLYTGTRSYFDSEVDGGYPRLLEAVQRVDTDLHAFMSQRFLDSAMYDVMWVPLLLPIEASVSKKPVKVYLKHRTEWQANRDLTGPYRALLKLASPETALKAVPKLMVQMFNFGHPETKKVLTGYHVVSFRGIPDVLEHWLLNAFRIYGHMVVDMAGGIVTDFHVDAPTSEGKVHNVPTSTITVHLTYEQK
ncbi:MAG: hypothetical protein KC582_00285 [Candidatus Magasanikbacteria bacterium]|nr:hypothetical protein [Candidatus Magasanikbacteria bacterium]MCA9390684.1 hypothetical protein [Candidatus Magasanikbacteria bacterium]